MACMCGDTHCGSCGPAQGNTKCSSCGEWEDDHAEHESDMVFEHYDKVMTFIKSLASGITPFDYHVIRTAARDLLAKLKAESCKHDEVLCEEKARLEAEAEAADEEAAQLREKEYWDSHEKWYHENKT